MASPAACPLQLQHCSIPPNYQTINICCCCCWGRINRLRLALPPFLPPFPMPFHPHMAVYVAIPTRALKGHCEKYYYTTRVYCLTTHAQPVTESVCLASFPFLARPALKILLDLLARSLAVEECRRCRLVEIPITRPMPVPASCARR